MTLNTTRSKVPHICVTSVPEPPNFSPFCSTTGHLGGTGQFEKSAPNNPKMTLNTARSKERIYVLLMSPSHRFHSVSLRVTGHFETSAWDDPKMILNTTRPKVAHIKVPESKVSPFCSTTSLFLRYKVVKNLKKLEMLRITLKRP